MYYQIYLKYLRYRIKYIKTVDDIIKIIKNIYFFNRAVDSDTLLIILTDCFTKYPLTEIEQQTLSVFQQKYDLEHGIENYTTLILWLSSLHSIQENISLKKI
jgi:hypothetical protein